MKITWSEPGVPISAAIHVALLLATLIVFSSTPKFEDAPEPIAVEMVSSSELTKMTKGDKTVTEVKPEAKPKADKVAEEEVIKPESADAKRDVPTPPAKPPAPQPETKPAPPPPPPVPTPPPPDVKPEPAPVDPKPEGLKQAPPPKPEPRPQPPKPESDQLAKLIDQQKTPAPPPKPVEAPKKSDPNFNADLQKLLVSKETPEKSASTSKEVSKTAAAGTTTGAAPKLSLSQIDQINGLVYKKVHECWINANLFPDPNRPVPLIHLKLREDGSLDGLPEVTNPSSDPAAKALEESAIRAVAGCAVPFDFLPKQFKSFYSEWQGITLRFANAD